MTPSDGSYVGPSSCNEYTDRLGAGQRVLSYSYYTPGLLISFVLLCFLFDSVRSSRSHNGCVSVWGAQSYQKALT